MFTSHLKRAYRLLNGKYKFKSPHCLRHTFATELAGVTLGDTTLCKSILGHRDEDTTKKYIHLFEQINQKMKMKVQHCKRLKTVD